MPLQTTTDASFDADVLASPSPVLVEFTAAWCPPCKMIAPVLDRIATEQAGRLTVVALDVDENPVTTRRYGVMGMPTLGAVPRRRDRDDAGRRSPAARDHAGARAHLPVRTV